jgi:dihydrolipoamide dehydrogenase
MRHYDVIVIGSGGGTKLVRPVAAMGKRVAIIEKGRLGGTCLNHGCIPSKMLIHTGELCDAIREAKKYNIELDTGEMRVDFRALVDRVTKTIDRDSDSIGPMYDKDPNIDLYRGHGRFVGRKEIEVNGERLSADSIFIAVGARPQIPDIPGLAGTPYMTYYEALRAERQPKRLVVVGGGYIAAELGYFFASIGTEVTFLVRSSFLKQEDADIRDEFTRAFTNKYDVRIGVVPKRVRHDGTEFHIDVSDGETLVADGLLMATGIEPMTGDLGLEQTDIRCNEEGFVVVDGTFKTTQPGVWALGDCIGRYFFRHSVNFEGEYLFRTLFADPHTEPIVYPPMPHAVFTNPEIASCGMRECDLEPGSYIVGKASYEKSARGMALMPEYGFVKLIFDRETAELIGAHIIGEEASNMIHLPIAVMNLGGRLHEMLHMIYVHPALPEIVRNAARNAARAFQQSAV